MNLRGKFLISVGAVLCAAFGVTFYRTSKFQDELVIAQAERQARMLASQIILTRKWVADHNGLFLIKGPGVEANPFLDDAEVKDSQGVTYVKRNPAMVTRELSEYAVHSDFWTFRVTSLKPVNPVNAPDDFESRSLRLFEEGINEVVEIQENRNGKVLRFMSPLEVEEPCLECHAKHGYQVGDIRGGLSLSIPMAWADRAIKENNRMLAVIAIFTIALVGGVIYLLLDCIVVRRLSFLAASMDDFPDKVSVKKNVNSSHDEIGRLVEKFNELGERLLASQADLEKAKELAFQAEKMAALGRLSAGIAHEVNNPLGGMQNCVKSMKESPENRQLHERYLDLLDKGLKRLERTMRQLLDFGRKESLKLQNISINDLIEECFSLMRYRLKDIAIHFDLRLQGKHRIDGEALRQVVVNLALNAAEAMPGGGDLSVASKMAGGKIMISISDTGEGIPPENIRKVFDPFFTTREVGKGTGLGLSVSFSLIDRMGGTIEVSSVPGQGARFDIILPILEQDEAIV